MRIGILYAIFTIIGGIGFGYYECKNYQRKKEKRQQYLAYMKAGGHN